MEKKMINESSVKFGDTTPDQHPGGLYRKLLTWFLFVALIPLLVVSIVSYNNAKESLLSASQRALVVSVGNKRHLLIAGLTTE